MKEIERLHPWEERGLKGNGEDANGGCSWIVLRIQKISEAIDDNGREQNTQE